MDSRVDPMDLTFAAIIKPAAILSIQLTSFIPLYSNLFSWVLSLLTVDFLMTPNIQSSEYITVFIIRKRFPKSQRVLDKWGVTTLLYEIITVVNQ